MCVYTRLPYIFHEGCGLFEYYEMFLYLTHLCTMMKWLATLPFHSYQVEPAGTEREPSPLLEAHMLVEAESKSETSLQVQSDKDTVDDVS